MFFLQTSTLLPPSMHWETYQTWKFLYAINELSTKSIVKLEDNLLHCKIVKRFKRALLRVCCRSLWAWTKASKEGTGIGPWYALKAWRAVDTCFAESTHLRVRAARVEDNGTMPLLVLMLLKFGDVNPSKLCRTSSARRASSSGERPCENVYIFTYITLIEDHVFQLEARVS